MEPLSTKHWIERYQKGDKKAFHKVYTAYYKKVYYTALKISRNQADAKDIAQETFLQVQKSLVGLKDVELFDQWLNRIIVSKASDLFRKNKTASFPEEHPVFQTSKEERSYMLPEAQLHFHSDQEMLRYFLDQLDDKYRIVLLLSYFDNMKIKEIAETLGIPDGTVKSRMSTGKEQLKEMIEQYQEQGQVQLNFKTSELSIVLASFFAQEFADMVVKIPVFNPFSSISTLSSTSAMHAATAGLCVVMAGTFAYASYQAYKIYDRQKQAPKQVLQANAQSETSNFQPIVYRGKTYDNPEDAFYELTLWAHCDVEMNEKSQADIMEIVPLYEAIKKEQGVYWKLMQFRGWNEKFEKNK